MRQHYRWIVATNTTVSPWLLGAGASSSRVSASRAVRQAVLMTTCVIGALAFVSPASAATVLSPADGETVGSRPTFAFDILDGAVEVELARAPDLLTSGGFVDTAQSLFATLYTRRPLDGLAPWSGGPITAGSYFWHVRVRDDSVDGLDWTPWQATRTLVVRDEAPVIGGYTLTARRAKPTPGCARVVFTGKVAWTDNDDKPETTLSLAVDELDGERLDTEDVTLDSGGEYTVSACTRRTRLTVTPLVSDRADQTTEGIPRTVKVSRPVVGRIPMLTVAKAKSHLREALSQRFGGSYRAAYGKRISDCSRRSRTRIRCRPSWVVGDLVFYGTASIWLTRDEAGYVDWNYGWTIRRLDEYCAEVTHSKNCVKTYRVT
jgi:hypothetical protein